MSVRPSSTMASEETLRVRVGAAAPVPRKTVRMASTAQAYAASVLASVLASVWRRRPRRRSKALMRLRRDRTLLRRRGRRRHAEAALRELRGSRRHVGFLRDFFVAQLQLF